ncbi:MAG TPA: hypothetical protein VE029_14605, partial [Rhizobacter sp.]|nr:hypothetical protein [Rhizobacter sp.]
MACAASFSLLGLAQAQPVAGPRSVPMAFTTGFESLKLNQGEHLGLVGGSLLFEAAPGWWLGPAVYGAATGQRGGFFVGGGELQKRWQLHQRLVAVTGVFAGGGGGGGAAVGGGLMLRPALSLLWDLGGWQTGPSVSSIYFPDGHIHSTQLGWILALNDRFAYQDWRRAGQLASTHERSGVGFDRIGLTLGRYRVRGTAQNIDAVGARADQWLTPRFFWSVEAAGAAHGGADGYAEVLGGLGAAAPLTPLGLPSLSLGARVSLGLGGGGAVQTGGGSLGKAAGSLTWNLSRNAYVGLETGYASAL